MGLIQFQELAHKAGVANKIDGAPTLVKSDRFEEYLGKMRV